MSGEKRQAPRIQPFVAPCRYVVADAAQSGFITDLSTRGGRIHTDCEPPENGTSLTVEIRLSRRPTRLKVPAAVEWGKPSPSGGYVFGVSSSKPFRARPEASSPASSRSSDAAPRRSSSDVG